MSCKVTGECCSDIQGKREFKWEEVKLFFFSAQWY